MRLGACGRATVGSTVFIFVSLMNTKSDFLVVGRSGMRKLASLSVVGFRSSPKTVCVSFHHPANFLNILSLHPQGAECGSYGGSNWPGDSLLLNRESLDLGSTLAESSKDTHELRSGSLGDWGLELWYKLQVWAMNQETFL